MLSFRPIARSLGKCFQRAYNQAKTETLKWEKTLASTKDYIAENELQTVSLIDSIQHLYTLLVRRNDDKIIFKRFDVGNQLDYIRDEIEIMEDIIRRANIKMNRETKSLLGEKGTGGVQNKGSNVSSN